MKLRRPEWKVDEILGQTIDPSNTIVITGFWRSGTSWLQQSIAQTLRAKSVFEPFHISIPAYRAAVGAPDSLLRPSQDTSPYGVGVRYQTTYKSLLDFLMPYTSGRDASGLEQNLKDYCRRTLTSSLPGHWIRNARTGRGRASEGLLSNWKVGRLAQRLREALKFRVVTKMCRGQLLLPALRSWFAPLLIHLRRDPRAIIPSFRRAFDDQWWGSLVLEDQLLKRSDGRRAFFQQWTDEIRRIDQRGKVARLAAYWALTEKHVRAHRTRSKHVTLEYEKLCLRGGSYLRGQLSPTLNERSVNWTFTKNSITTNTSRRATDSAHRIDSWKEESDVRSIRTVETVLDMFDMTEHLPTYS